MLIFICVQNSHLNSASVSTVNGYTLKEKCHKPENLVTRESN
jgi:hypothetical protein